MWNLKDKITRRFTGTAKARHRSDNNTWDLKLDIGEPSNGITMTQRPLTTPVGTLPGVYKGQRTVPPSVYADQTATRVLPKITDEPPLRVAVGGLAAHKIATANNDKHATNLAKKAVLDGNWRTALAGIIEYVNTHPATPTLTLVQPVAA
jgi:hypothetical protein